MRQAALISFTVLLLSTTAAQAAELALKRVVLSTGGVGYYEYETTIDGAGDVQLTVRRDQVDDALKSLVVYDAKGRVARVSLPGQDSESGLFREMPFRPEALGNPITLLQSLVGAEIETSGAQALRGRLMGIMADAGPARPDLPAPRRHRVSVLTARGIQHFIFEEAESLRFVDPVLQAQLERALVGAAKLASRERRTIAIRVEGESERRLRVAFVAGAPLWKATYRATLSADPAAREAALHGFAVVENESGEDWRDVELTLVSGSPITFRQSLYAPYYVERPLVPVEVWGRVLPPSADQGATQAMGRIAAAPAQAQAAPMPRQRAAQEQSAMPLGAGAAASADAASLALAGVVASDAREGDTQVAFRVPSTVSVASGHSLMVPLIARDVPVERLSVFRDGANARNPLMSVRLTNAGASALPPGVVTIYERARGGEVDFLGDARLGPVPAGENRLVSFAVDFKTRVDVEHGAAQRLDRLKAADGLLTLTRIERQRSGYAIVVAPGERRRVMIEHPRPSAEWRVVTPEARDLQLAPEALRSTREVGGDKPERIEFAFERPLEERIELASLSADSLRGLLRSTVLSATQREALERLGALAATANDRKGAAERLAARLESVIADQRRVRDNIGYAQGEQQRRYRDQMTALEERIGALQGQIEAARGAAEAAQDELKAYLRALSF